MSLEQALADNTAAIRDLIAAFTRAPEVAEPAKRGPGRPKKTEAAPATRYFFRQANDVVYRIEPADPVQEPMEGSVEITADEFTAHEARIAAKYKHLSADTAPSEVDPPQADPEVKPADLMARVVVLSQKADGRARMEKILAEFGVPKFSLLPAQHLTKALDLVNKSIDE